MSTPNASTPLFEWTSCSLSCVLLGPLSTTVAVVAAILPLKFFRFFNVTLFVTLFSEMLLGDADTTFLTLFFTLLLLFVTVVALFAGIIVALSKIIVALRWLILCGWCGLVRGSGDFDDVTRGKVVRFERVVVRAVFGDAALRSFEPEVGPLPTERLWSCCCCFGNCFGEKSEILRLTCFLLGGEPFNSCTIVCGGIVPITVSSLDFLEWSDDVTSLIVRTSRFLVAPGLMLKF